MINDLIILYRNDKMYLSNLNAYLVLAKQNYGEILNRHKKGLSTQLDVDNSTIELAMANREFYEKLVSLDYSM